MKRLTLVSTLFIIVTMTAVLIPTVVGSQGSYALQGAETRITTSLADQYDPAISGNIVVYTDNRVYDNDIWYYNLSTGIEAPVTTAVGDQQLPDVCDGLVVYTDYATIDVQLFSVADGTTTNLTGAAKSSSGAPGIGQGLVAWEDNRDGNLEIYARNLATGEERRITNSPAFDQRPRVNNGVIVWQSSVNNISYICDIYSYDWASGTTRQITATPLDDERDPDVFGNYVVYDGLRNGNRDIYLFDLTIGTEKVLSMPGDQVRPNISGEFVAFEDVSTGLYHVMLWHLPTGKVFDLTAAANGPPATAGQYLNDIDGNRVVYTDDRNGQLDIYMYQFTVVSPSIQVSPQLVNFGDVEKGKSTMAIVSISNTGQLDLNLTGVSLTADSSSAFSITSAPAAPIPPGGSADVTIIFAPTAVGSFSGTLQVNSDDPYHGTVQVPLSGNGIVKEEPPEQQIQGILQFFDDSVNKGILPGSGPGNSANNRRAALRNMIEAAGDLIHDGNIAAACQQLYDAYQKTDGQPQPPDFVTGSAAPDLASRILKLMQTLGCPQCNGL